MIQLLVPCLAAVDLRFVRSLIGSHKNRPNDKSSQPSLNLPLTLTQLTDCRCLRNLRLPHLS